MFSHLDEVEMTERCRKEHPLMGYSAENLINKKAEIKRSDVQPLFILMIMRLNQSALEVFT